MCVVEPVTLYCSVIFDSSVVFRGPPCNHLPCKILAYAAIILMSFRFHNIGHTY